MNAVTVNNIIKTYGKKKEVKAVNDISFTVQRENCLELSGRMVQAKHLFSGF